METDSIEAPLVSFKSTLQSKDVALVGSGIVDTVLVKNSEWMKIPELLRVHYAGNNLETRNACAEVFWNLVIDYREWGVKSISVVVTEVKINFDLAIYSESVQEIRGIEWSSESVDIFGQSGGTRRWGVGYCCRQERRRVPKGISRSS